MDSIANTAREALTSQRLEYQAFDPDSEELLEFIHKYDSNDLEVEALSLASPPKPKTKKQTGEYIRDLAMCDFIVTINLRHNTGGPEKTSASDDKTTGPALDKTCSTLIGYIGLGSPGGIGQHQCAVIMISLASPYQNKGYGSETINWIVDYGFRYQNLHSIAIEAVSFNERAIALYQKLGFTVDGRKRENVRYGRERYDTVEKSLLVHEWEKLRR